MLDFTGKSKWDAWKKNEGTGCCSTLSPHHGLVDSPAGKSTEAAMTEYIAEIERQHREYA